MKVRAVAGARGFGARMELLAKDIAFSVALDRPMLAHIEDLRKRAQSQASPLDLKKWEGGTSDIEFATRLLQLKHVGEWPELRRGDVLGAVGHPAGLRTRGQGSLPGSSQGLYRSAAHYQPFAHVWRELRLPLARIRGRAEEPCGAAFHR